MMNTIFIEFDNTKLQNLSEKLYTIFIQNNYDTIILNNNMSIDEKMNLINNSINPVLISNKINNDNSNTMEIIYQLRKNDTLAKLLSDKLSNIANVSKYYQLRSLDNTKLDYYEILRNTNSEAIIIKYGNNIINNEQLPLIIFQTINNYLNNNNNNIYIVVSGDSLYAIARKFNTTVDDIKKANNLSSNLLSIGQKLIIPNSNNTNNNQNIYTVVSGDSLYAIAKKFNTTVDNLKNTNNLNSNLLSIGQKLIIPNNTNTYTVIKGDTLYAIAKKFNTTVNDIKKLNNLNTNSLSIGQKLLIP